MYVNLPHTNCQSKINHKFEQKPKAPKAYDDGLTT